MPSGHTDRPRIRWRRLLRHPLEELNEREVRIREALQTAVTTVGLTTLVYGFYLFRGPSRGGVSPPIGGNIIEWLLFAAEWLSYLLVHHWLFIGLLVAVLGAAVVVFNRERRIHDAIARIDDGAE